MMRDAAPSSRALLRAVADVAIAAALPDHIRHFLPPQPKGRTVVVGAGKAVTAMAKALETAWDGPLSGTIITRKGQTAHLQSIRVLEAAHPVPDAHSVAGAEALLEAVQGLSDDDLVIALISGGASSLITLPADGMTLEDLQAVNRSLLQSGADIAAMNVVRKHLSRISGGRLARAAFPARVVTLAISDVPGDDPAMIGSGPTVPDPSTRQDALEIVKRFGLVLPETALRHLNSPASESAKAGEPCFSATACHLIARPIDSLKAAAQEAQRLGLRCHILGDAWEGEAREVAKAQAGLVRSVLDHGLPFSAPCLLLSGGETTVSVKGNAGRGGRNTEFLLSLALALAALPKAQQARIHALAIDTDGIDGSEDNAGAIMGPDTLERGRALGLDARAMLDAHDAWSFFNALDSLVVTGPTNTNVNDFRAILLT